MKPPALSIHIAVNSGDPAHYLGLQPLSYAENDAHAMQRLAAKEGYDTRILLGTAATTCAVSNAISEAARKVGSDGILLITYSGHGSEVRDQPSAHERKGWDQSWCLYNRMLIDDELFHLWGEFQPGARVVVVSDSCFSGTVIRVGNAASSGGRPAQPGIRSGQRLQARALQSKSAKRTIQANLTEYREVRRCLASKPERKPDASVILLAAAPDDKRAFEVDGHGLFTFALLETWKNGTFAGSYMDLLGDINKYVLEKRTKWGRRELPYPEFFRQGFLWPQFEAQRAFAIETPPRG